MHAIIGCCLIVLLILTDRVVVRAQLQKVAAQSGGAPFTYEHRGVHEAVARIGQDNVTPAAMHAALHDISKTAADKAVIGNVLNAFIGADLSLWCTIVMDEQK